jgi:hypothetical protein
MRMHTEKRLRYVLPVIPVIGTVLLLVLFDGIIHTPPMDDTYIHLVYGRSILSAEPLCFNSSEPSSGFTSPLWLIPSAIASLAGTKAAPMILMLLSLFAAATALFLLPAITGMLLLMVGPFFFHSGTGMETALAALAVIAVWKCIETGGRVRTASLILAGAFLIRPELAVLIIPMALALKDRNARNLLRLALPSIMAGFLWLAWNFHATGFLLPSTFYAKQPVSWFASALRGIPGLLKGLLIVSPFFLFASAISVAGMLKNRKTERPVFSLALIPLLLFTVSLFLQPNSYFQLRYYVPALTAAALATGKWLYGLHRWKLNTFILLASMLPGLIIFAIRRADASSDVFSIDVEPSQYLLGTASPDQTVAAADIGAVRWITGLNIIDLDGLVTVERLPGAGMQGWSFVRESSDYLLAFPSQYEDLLLEAGDSIEFLIGFGSDRNVICGEDSVSLWKIL